MQNWKAKDKMKSSIVIDSAVVNLIFEELSDDRHPLLISALFHFISKISREDLPLSVGPDVYASIPSSSFFKPPKLRDRAVVIPIRNNCSLQPWQLQHSPSRGEGGARRSRA